MDSCTELWLHVTTMECKTTNSHCCKYSVSHKCRTGGGVNLLASINDKLMIKVTMHSYCTTTHELVTSFPSHFCTPSSLLLVNLCYELKSAGALLCTVGYYVSPGC